MNPQFTLGYHKITELFILEKTFKIIKTDYKTNTANATTNPCP